MARSTPPGIRENRLTYRCETVFVMQPAKDWIGTDGMRPFLRGDRLSLALTSKRSSLRGLLKGAGPIYSAAMSALLLPLQMLLLMFAGWVNRHMSHYHEERNHQGLENRLLRPLRAAGESHAPVKRRQRLGGMLSYHHREAA